MGETLSDLLRLRATSGYNYVIQRSAEGLVLLKPPEKQAGAK